MWIIVDRTNKTVAGTAYQSPPPNAWKEDLFEVIEWLGAEPAIGSPDPRPSASWDDVRAIRDALLRNCDWTQLPDAPLSPEEAEAYRAYRTELRDLPQAFSSPADVRWPAPPSSE